MNITVNVDITPEELRRFMGLPDVQGLQEEMLKMAHKQLTESGQNAFNDILAGAVQPMMAYQDWLQRMMVGSLNTDDEAKSKKKGSK